MFIIIWFIRILACGIIALIGSYICAYVLTIVANNHVDSFGEVMLASQPIVEQQFFYDAANILFVVFFIGLQVAWNEFF